MTEPMEAKRCPKCGGVYGVGIDPCSCHDPPPTRSECDNAAEIAALLDTDFTVPGPLERSPNPRDLLTDQELAEHQAKLKAISRAVAHWGFWR